ncbi:SO_0444 family Cu/Zn efflux transporter [Candidatus Electronema sp. PJ]|uniref:SO_0444 family Cu/Zn efflux transporter n=1 Tax=Candidatus Electronema sp. PJ TaxID=3401572 RepID=UPI003AA905C1
MLSFIGNALQVSWQLLNQSAFYILSGLLVGGLLKMYLSPAYVAAHLGKGRFSSVFKAALLGVPIPLCSCGVLPAAATLKKQGANNGAVTAFLISTPESGVDSIAMTWALLDPIMTVARPVSAFISAAVAGVLENSFSFQYTPPQKQEPSLSSSCCAGESTVPRGFLAKLKAGLHYATTELWPDLAGWFFTGIIVAGFITVLVPDEVFASWLGGGLSSMLLMLALGIPLYICASASTPIAAAFILKGVSPGTALVFLLTGPATNVTSLFVLIGMLGKRATALYLLSIAVVSVLCGLAVDAIYLSLGISAAAVVGKHSTMLPHWVMLAATLVLFALSIRPLLKICKRWFGGGKKGGGSCCGMQQAKPGEISNLLPKPKSQQ